MSEAENQKIRIAEEHKSRTAIAKSEIEDQDLRIEVLRYSFRISANEKNPRSRKIEKQKSRKTDKKKSRKTEKQKGGKAEG
jgi:hypothetical protein